MNPTTESVVELYLAVEAKKANRGIPGTATQAPKFLRLVSSWKPSTLTPVEIERLQLTVSPDSEKDTFQIFQTLGTAHAGQVASYLAQINPNDHSAWLSRVNHTLIDRVRQLKVEPVILVYPCCFVQGNVFDGNHRVLAALLNQDINNQVDLPAIIGKIPWISWCLYFIRSFALSGNIGTGDRLNLAKERLRSIDGNYFRN
jgi:hypothetical protein